MLTLRLRVWPVNGGARPKEARRTNIYSAWPPLKRLRRRLLGLVCRLPDTGIFGLCKLRSHILVCGFPRCGTTMLQMMLENALPHARRFGYEIGGWRAATYSWRNHAVMISKVPHDVFRLEPLRDFYRGRSARLRIILMVRDPRDVLTSKRLTGGPSGYCVGIDRWRRYYQAFTRHRDDADVLVIRYEELVRHPASQQMRVEQFTDESMSVPFANFHLISRLDFDQSTLNGLRPVGTSLIGRWAAPEHRERIAQVLRHLPELPHALIRLGYERDEAWTIDHGMIDHREDEFTPTPTYAIAAADDRYRAMPHGNVGNESIIHYIGGQS